MGENIVMDRFRLSRGGEGRKTLALLGLRFENPGYGFRLFRGGEGQGTLALLGLRLESRVRISETAR